MGLAQACLLLFILAFCEGVAQQSYTLDGSPNSFIHFGPWFEGPLGFEFQTESPSGLLLFAEEDTSGNFLELKLVEGSLRLRSGRPFTGSIGRNLHDSQWHRVDLWTQGGADAVFRVDDESRVFSGLQARNFSGVFVGGVPSPRASLFSAYFEPRFRGTVRQLTFKGEPAARPRSHSGLRHNQLDVCEAGNPCQAGGTCLSTDTGALCDCRNSGFTGPLCDQDIVHRAAAFQAKDSYKLLTNGSFQSSSETFSFYFKSRHANGLFLKALSSHYGHLSVSLRAGGVVLATQIGTGQLERVVRPPKVRFDDNQWHRVEVRRKVREIARTTGYCHVSLTVDDVYTERGSIAGNFNLLETDEVILGASGLELGVVGCLKKVELEADSVVLDLLQLLRNASDSECELQDPHDPITFTTGRSNVRLAAWRFVSLAFKFRTTEGDGVLAYSPQHQAALELDRGRIVLVPSPGAERIQLESPDLADGKWHTLSLRRSGRSGRLTVDDSAMDFSRPDTEDDVEGVLYIGGGPSPDIWSQGYTGCLRDLVVDSVVVDIAQLARGQDSASVRPACHSSVAQCDSGPCLHGGRCVEGWNRYKCDCRGTSYTGPACAHDAATLTFDGQQFFKLIISEGSRTESEVLFVRFRTARPSGLLFAANSDKSHTHVTASLEDAKLHVVVNLGSGDLSFTKGHYLADLMWHTVSVKRREASLEIEVDGEFDKHELHTQGRTLQIDTLYVGAVDPPAPNSFVGQMQHFSFNDRNYFEESVEGHAEHFHVTAQYNKLPRSPHLPVAVKSKYTFIALPQLKAYFAIQISFQFKTSEPNGLILYNGGKKADFLALELVGGHLHYLIHLGDSLRQVKTDNPLNDNQWHTVSVLRKTRHQHTLIVDNKIYSFSSSDLNLHLDGLLFIAGVQRFMYDGLAVKSRHGFLGCFASLEVDGVSLDLIQDAAISSTLVAKGCPDPVTKCTSSACANHGLCVQLWNTYTCDCDLTSFSGLTCSEESIAYEFGPGTGIVVFHFPPDKQPDTKSDLLALGFLTMARNALLVRVDSGTSNDYLELEIVDGNLFVVYNMGTDDHPIGEPSVQVSDGHYHVVRFTRTGPNSTLQVDEHNVRLKTPEGNQLSVFNSLSKVQVGGKKNPTTGTILKPFQGVISGLVFNGYRVLDLTAEDDPRVGVEGDVELLMSLPYNAHSAPQMQNQPAGYDTVSDDLVFPNAGSGCWDDEDNCGVEEFGSGDDLITPVYIPPTPKPTPTTSTTSTSTTPDMIDMVCDDEEECAEGSGLGHEEGEHPPRASSPPAPQPPSTTTTTTTDSPIHIIITNRPPLERPTTTVSTVSTTRPPPVEYPVPIPEFPSPGREQQKPLPKPQRPAMYTAMMIALSAGVLIAVILIVLMLYRLRPLLGLKADLASGTPAAAPAAVDPHMNGSVKTPPKIQKKKDVKDLKEWYV